jgi:hypothetical protein
MRSGSWYGNKVTAVPMRILARALRDRGADDRRAPKNAAEGVKVVLGQPDGGETEILGVRALFDDTMKAIGCRNLFALNQRGQVKYSVAHNDK